ncbi:hypothetical protein BD289DRAFT_373662 [Coniella lustricola]|uniref:F-box domain-containing protein n=1 Tax=Coniella lustricola TaxID=2025994 RepID=A0A2T3A0N1_9PEZI|nr:hypothetical protein BD289DRAFT_373662 [Coniella lustricola]
MQTESIDSISGLPASTNPVSTSQPSQDGLHSSSSGAHQGNSHKVTPGSSAATPGDGEPTEQLDEVSRRLSGWGNLVERPGQRIAAYENATTPTTPQYLAFKVVKRSGSPVNGPLLSDCPNEILTQILSHLHPDSHGSVALVSKRFYALITEPHAWRMAFLRYFPGQEALKSSSGKVVQQAAGSKDDDTVRSEFRHFTRLTSLASWRSEYLLRTRLLRSIARGKPSVNSSGLGSSSRSSHSTKKASAVLTYNSKLPWVVSNVHAVFDSSKKGSKVIVGTTDLCVSTVSDPSTGKIEKWGLDDPFAFAQIDELFPNLQPFGVADGPAAVYNVMDLSQPYGMLGGEGFPGGRPYFRGTNELRGRYLGAPSSNIIDMSPEVPKIPELLEAICSVWIAKSSAVPSITQNMVGMLTGSTLGVVTAYALGHDSKGPQYKAGDMTARWVLSPGVPIIALKVDESYNFRRRTLGRIWACAVNALGECFVLTTTPTPPSEAVRKELDHTKAAWLTGRSVYWQLIESTRRKARPDDMDKNAVRGGYSPRSPCDAMRLSKAQLVGEAREIEKFFRYDPAHFRRACEGWDMRRRVEVDFAEEIVVIFRCIQEEECPAEALRLIRIAPSRDTILEADAQISSFNQDTSSSALVAGVQCDNEGLIAANFQGTDEEAHISAPVDAGQWRTSTLSLKKLGKADISTTAMDNSLQALIAPFEDPLDHEHLLFKSGTSTPTARQHFGDIPGRRARFVAIGTDHGKVIAWNVRDESSDIAEPVFAAQTESPDITSLALSALYLVTGGSDGLVQAWDPLVSTSEPIRTLCTKSSGRAPRHIVNANPALRLADYSACPAIFLDADATSLRGVLCFGTFIRYWTYSSAAPSIGRRRRTRQPDVHGHLASRRQGHAVKGYIAAEEAELRHEQEHTAREQARLRDRYGVGLADLTEEEAIRYAQMISEEAFLNDELRRTSASDTGSAADFGETTSTSTSNSLDTVTPEASVSGQSPAVTVPASSRRNIDDGDDFEEQLQRALRLSLMESENDLGQLPQNNSSADVAITVAHQAQNSNRSVPASFGSSRVYTPLPLNQSWRDVTSPPVSEDIDEDLALALRLSLEDEELRKQRENSELFDESDRFPPLETSGKGKGVGRY